MLSRPVASLRLEMSVAMSRLTPVLPFAIHDKLRTLRNVRRREVRPLELTPLAMIRAKPDVIQTLPHVVTKLDAELVAPLLPHLPRFRRSRPLTVVVMLVYALQLVELLVVTVRGVNTMVTIANSVVMMVSE